MSFCCRAVYRKYWRWHRCHQYWRTMDYLARCWQRPTRIVIAVWFGTVNDAPIKAWKVSVCVYMYMHESFGGIKRMNERGDLVLCRTKMRGEKSNKWTRPSGMTLNKNQVYDRMRHKKSNVRKRLLGIMAVALMPRSNVESNIRVSGSSINSDTRVRLQCLIRHSRRVGWLWWQWRHGEWGTCRRMRWK